MYGLAGYGDESEDEHEGPEVGGDEIVGQKQDAEQDREYRKLLIQLLSTARPPPCIQLGSFFPNNQLLRKCWVKVGPSPAGQASPRTLGLM